MGGIVLYGAALAVLAFAIFVTSVHGVGPLADPELPWWAIAVFWALAETCVVHLHFRRSAHSFSLADFPFVFGLAFASGDGFVVGALVGAGAAYAFRRLPPVKLAFNLAQLALAVCVAFVIVRALDRSRRHDRAAYVDRALRRHAGDRGALDRLHRRCDRDRRAQHDARHAAPDVLHGPRADGGQREHRDRRRGARLHRRPRRAAAAGAGGDRVRSLPRLRLRTPAPRAARIPLRGQPRPHALPGGRGGDRGRPRPLAGGVPLRDRRGHPVQRRRHAAAEHLRPGRRARDDGRGRP